MLAIEGSRPMMENAIPAQISYGRHSFGSLFHTKHFDHGKVASELLFVSHLRKISSVIVSSQPFSCSHLRGTTGCCFARRLMIRHCYVLLILVVWYILNMKVKAQRRPGLGCLMLLPPSRYSPRSLLACCKYYRMYTMIGRPARISQIGAGRLLLQGVAPSVDHTRSGKYIRNGICDGG